MHWSCFRIRSSVPVIGFDRRLDLWQERYGVSGAFHPTNNLWNPIPGLSVNLSQENGHRLP